MKYYIGLDNGGTTTKAALFTQEGKELCVSSVSTKMITPRPNFTERDMEEMWQANISVIRGVLEKSKVSPEDIHGLAVCGHGKGLYLWGKNNKPAYNGIISTDTRAESYVDRWKTDGTEDKIFRITCQHIMACQAVSLLAWLKDNQPEVIPNIQWVFECKDYIRFRLTGEAHAEITDYSGANLLNLHTRNYDERILDLFNIPEIRAALPPLCKAYEECGRITAETSALTGLKAGTPVAGGMFDIDACALAANITNENHLCAIAGTWSINEYIRKEPIMDGSVLMNSIFCIPEYYLVEESSATSAGNLEWFITNLLPELKAEKKAHNESIYDEINAEVASISINEFIPIFLPFLMASNVNPYAKSCFVGISNYHTRAHLLRSIYEGIVFCHRYHIDKLLHSRQQKPESIRLAGGAAKSAIWAQMFADVLQLPVETIDANETGALGCAIAASTAAGDYKTLQDAASHMCKISSIHYPNPANAAIYERKYQLYLHTIQAIDPLWEEIKQMIEAAY